MSRTQDGFWVYSNPDADMLTLPDINRDTSLGDKTLAQMKAQEELLAMRWEMHLMAREFASTGPINWPLLDVTFASCLDRMRDFAVAYHKFKKEVRDCERHV